MDENSKYADFYKEFERKVKDYDQDYCKMAFEDVVARIIKDEKRYAEKKSRRRIDALRSVMKRLEPAIQLDDTFEQVCQRLQGKKEFDISNEEKRTAYDKFMYRLNEKVNGDPKRHRHDSRERKRRRSRSSERSRKSDSEDDDHKRKRDRKSAPQSDSEEEGELR